MATFGREGEGPGEYRSPDGGISDRYAIHVSRPDGTVLRIERAADPVSVRAVPFVARFRIEH